MTKTNIIGVIIGVAGVAYAYYSDVKMRALAEKLDLTLDDLSKKTDVEIDEAMLKTAAEQAVNREVGTLARRAAVSACVNVEQDMKKQVEDIVSKEYDDISTKVLSEVTERVSNIDESDLKRRVTKSAEAKLLSKFEGSLDSLLSKHNDNLDTITKVYNSIYGTIKDRDRLNIPGL